MTPEEHEAVESAFIAGFRHAGDKLGFLRLARIPLELHRPQQPGLKLMQVIIEDTYEVGRASPGFASRELVYHPLPGKLVTAAARLRFRYVSALEVCELDLATLTHLAAGDSAHGPNDPRTPMAGEEHRHGFSAQERST
jgi:hypothetical protein